MNTLIWPRRYKCGPVNTAYSETAGAEKSHCTTPGASAFFNRTNKISVPNGKWFLQTQLLGTLTQNFFFSYESTIYYNYDLTLFIKISVKDKGQALEKRAYMYTWDVVRLWLVQLYDGQFCYKIKEKIRSSVNLQYM